MKHIAENCLKYFWDNFWKNLQETVREIPMKFSKKNIIMYKGNYGLILGKNWEGILKKYLENF